MLSSGLKIKNTRLIILWHHLSKRRKNQLFILIIIMLIASLTEVVSIGSVVPFLGALTAPEQVYQYSFIQPLISFLELSEPRQIVLPITILFIVVAIFSGIIRLVLLLAITRLSYAIGADLSVDIYRRTLYQEYEIHIERNSSEVINGVTSKTNTVIAGIVNPILNLISSAVLLIGIIVALFTINTVVALISLVGFGLFYLIIVNYTKKILARNGEIIANQSTKVIKYVQEGLGGIRDVLINNSQKFYYDLYHNADLSLRRASGNNVFISGGPKYIMEIIGMTLIASIAYIMVQQDGGMNNAVPILGAMALGAQKLLPLLQQAYASYSRMKGASASFKDVINLLEQPLPDYVHQSNPESVSFNKDIVVNNLSFRYGKYTPWVLKDINIKIPKGFKVGFIGATGSGKSTLLDIIMGLLAPTTGHIVIDGEIITSKNRKSWQNNIAHVPQNIYLSDGTIEENIAFGVDRDKINKLQVIKSAKQAQIDGLINGWKDGYETFVGEQGIRLSGGQRQRIGIARALYKQSSVLIFDESTSALDNDTEQNVMKSINKLDRELTILIIAHRLTTLKDCDLIVQIDANNIIRTGSYQSLIILGKK